ncbi:hypothetical protein TNIN_144541 [Trichonephila inaurata madagascariensis]|uniref:Uncharacterized protein n=1 Tax=Trichonephila inaurata madagascariensis TaxID=2747483 RepID=A0A8X7CF02_9ARAC|nr:hypothetical protein TNIN_144541 [Trichonephila inaurata madagascariensis]
MPFKFHFLCSHLDYFLDDLKASYLLTMDPTPVSLSIVVDDPGKRWAEGWAQVPDHGRKVPIPRRRSSFRLAICSPSTRSRRLKGRI